MSADGGLGRFYQVLVAARTGGAVTVQVVAGAAYDLVGNPNVASSVTSFSTCKCSCHVALTLSPTS